eukprot:EC814525.1.p5 GENE.EC814525.1~~EC814525.1.p5  ORF type:complete len:75 (-),score=25.12 EC814525.1:356-580(-)
MSSGFGVKGGQGRCFPFWMDFAKCMSDADTPAKCTLQREDYLECLHHKKELTRLKRIEEERMRQKHAAAHAGGH